MADETVDVLIVGAGLSGIGAACHLQKMCPGHRVAIIEARQALGGTWDLFRYPGVRSDSDMYTLGYSFRPWTGDKAIAEGPAILQYLRDTAREHGIEKRIRFGHRLRRAAWSSAEAAWTVDIERDAAEPLRLRCAFLLMCIGYYDDAEGYTPEFEGRERFAGRIVHPQHWTEDIAYAGRRVVVIGSGATAVTLVPALAERAAHVTMLQRSPSYVLSRPSADPVARWLQRVAGAGAGHAITRWKNLLLAMYIFRLCRRRPQAARSMMIKLVRRQLGPDYDIATHFTPRYDPWEQRLCLVPDGDLFKAIRAGRASIVTDRIERFTERGLQLAGGAELEADLVVTATAAAGRARVQRRRPAAGRLGTGQLQGADVRRRPQPGVHLRLHECLVDTEGRPGQCLRVPIAAAHAAHRRTAVPAAARPARPAACTVDRFLVGLLPARDGPAAQAGREETMEAEPELPGRPGEPALRGAG